MIDLVQLIGAVVSGVLLLVVLELVRRRRLSEEYSFFWIIGVIVLLGLSLWRGILDVTARWLGVYYPPMVLVLALVLVVFIGLLYFSVVTSSLRRQIERLVEEQAILDADLRELSSARSPSDPRPVTAEPVEDGVERAQAKPGSSSAA